MRIKQIEVFSFAELSDEAKEKARVWYMGAIEGYWWGSESLKALNVFCAEFGTQITEYSLSPPGFKTAQGDFRGRKLREFSRGRMPTGYYLDCALWETFYDEFRRTGDAKGAFTAALKAGFEGWQSDVDYQNSDEGISACEYEFTADGEISS